MMEKMFHWLCETPQRIKVKDKKQSNESGKELNWRLYQGFYAAKHCNVLWRVWGYVQNPPREGLVNVTAVVHFLQFDFCHDSSSLSFSWHCPWRVMFAMPTILKLSWCLLIFSSVSQNDVLGTLRLPEAFSGVPWANMWPPAPCPVCTSSLPPLQESPHIHPPCLPDISFRREKGDGGLRTTDI